MNPYEPPQFGDIPDLHWLERSLRAFRGIIGLLMLVNLVGYSWLVAFSLMFGESWKALGFFVVSVTAMVLGMWLMRATK